MEELSFKKKLMELARERIAEMQNFYDLHNGMSLKGFSSKERGQIEFDLKTYEFNRKVEAILSR